jgi:DNA topoisomerase-1
VFATGGHLMQMPERLTPIGIDSSFREFARAPRNEWVLGKLRELAAQCRNVVVATDADQEGDVIAWDVAEAVRDLRPDPVRVRLRAVDPDSLREALGQAGAVRREDAVPGRTRAAVDRVIGAVFSADGVAVGRVATALLGLVREQPPAVRLLRLVAPARDGGRPFSAECPVEAPLDAATATRLAGELLPAIDLHASSKAARTKPNAMGEIMVRAGDRLGLSPGEAARHLQKAYEAGQMSYPRAGERALSPAARRSLARMFKKAGYKADEEEFEPKGPDAVHDAPHPTGKLELGRSPDKVDSEQALVTLVGRDLVKCGQRHVEERGAGEGLRPFLGQRYPDKVVEHVVNMHWRREVGPQYPGQDAWPESGVVERRRDTVVLEAMVRNSLGRPSTWAAHVEAFAGRDLVDSEMRLTAKGREWLAASPALLVDPRMSAAIERACETDPSKLPSVPGREPWEVLAERIVGALPAALREPMQSALRAEVAPAVVRAPEPEPSAAPAYAPD